MPQSTAFFSRIETDHESIEWKVKARAGTLVEAIKAFRGLTGAGLKESKDAVEEYNYRLKNGGRIGETSGFPKDRTVTFPGGWLTISPNSFGRFTITKTLQSTVRSSVDESSLLQAVADIIAKHNEESRYAG